MRLATALWTFLRALSTGAAGVALENLALRHQLWSPAVRGPTMSVFSSMGPRLFRSMGPSGSWSLT